MCRASLLAPIVVASLLSGCGGSDSSSTTNSGTTSRTSGAPVVHTVNYPLMYFAQRIGGDHVDVRFIAPGDGDPAFWEPGDDAIAALQAADLILLNGATYEKWLGYVSVSESSTVDTSTAFADQFIEIESTETHSHGGEGEHSHAGTAFTTWLDMTQARAHADAVLEALSRLHPDAAADFESAASALMADIDALDSALVEVAKTIGAQPLVASHPVYQYFARRYDLDIESVLWEPETVPSEADMAELGAILADHPAGWMIWEGDPAAESVAKLTAIGVESVVFDPCGNRPDDGDWLSVMRANIENLKAIGR